MDCWSANEPGAKFGPNCSLIWEVPRHFFVKFVQFSSFGGIFWVNLGRTTFIANTLLSAFFKHFMCFSCVFQTLFFKHCFSNTVFQTLCFSNTVFQRLCVLFKHYVFLFFKHYVRFSNIKVFAIKIIQPIIPSNLKNAIIHSGITLTVFAMSESPK